MAWNCADGTPEEDHDWQIKSDWYGDPGVINGTCTFYVKRCRQCGKEEEPTDREIYDAAHDYYED